MSSYERAYKKALEKIKRVQREELTSLNLTGLGLKSLPLEITTLTNLTNLYLGFNQLFNLPPEFTKLTNLTTLDINGNRLTALPLEITQISNLTTLDLSGNELTALPPEFRKLTKLRWFSLDGNPLEIPPPEIIKQGIKAIRAYFEEIEKGETIQLFEAKLLIVGQGGVGKTYLKNRLMYDETPETVSTEGIDINEWTISTRQTDTFRANFWDFGGQEIYHATHQFFLTKRSLYLFVWEARTDADLLSFDYWLNTIKVLSDNSPVLVIQNKIDERKKPINQEGWQKRFPNIAGYHDVSATVGTGCADLKTAIIQHIEALPHIGDVLPKRWVDIRRALEALDENFIAYARYRDLCAAHEMDDVQADRLSEYYHDLGVFLHFKDNPILRNTIFLKSEWATDAVYKVADNQRVRDAYGTFHFDDLGAIWQDKQAFPPDKHVELVELMKSFELCFELPAGQTYIIPELLRAGQPDFDWDDTQNLRFKYVYDFMPAGVMTRFIVRTHDLIKGDLYWKDGVVLTWENTDALVVKTDLRVIEVWLRGDDKKTLLGMIRRDMDYINKPFSNLEVSEMVPCLCDVCRDDPAPYFHDYHYLLKARKKRTDTLCQKSDDLVPIDHLLSGIGPKAPERPVSKPRAFKLFLASSGELKDERERVELLIRRENSRLNTKNIFLDLVIWEELKRSFHGDRIQDYFNEKMLECDVVIFLFWKKVGDFTKEEFDVAYRHFKEGKKPRYLYVFFKSGKVDIDEIDEEILKIKKLKKEIEDAEQIYKSFKSNEDLVLQLTNQLALIIPEMTA